MQVVFKKSGGAGRAASNLSNLLKNESETTSIDSITIKRRRIKLIIIYLLAIFDNYIIKKRNAKSFFSIYRSNFNSINDVEDISQEKTLHLQWIPGMISLKKLDTISRNNKIIITLHDMWFFTGGCHFNSGCNQYKSGCLDCPQIKKNHRNKVHQQFQLKQKIFSQAADVKIIAPSKWIKNLAEESMILTDMNIKLIDNAPPVESINYKSRQDLRNKFGISSTDFVVGFISVNIRDKRKNIDELILALEKFCSIHKKEVNTVLLTKGKGKIKNNKLFKIVNLGYSDVNEELTDFYGVIDLLAVTSSEDNAPLVVYEALINDVPIAYKRTGGLVDQLEGNNLGKPYSTTEELAEILVDISFKHGTNFAPKNNYDYRQLVEEIRLKHLEVYE